MSEREKLVEKMLAAYWGRRAKLTRRAAPAMSAALTVAEAEFERRERHEPRGCPTPGACSCLRSEAAIRADEREACAKQLEARGQYTTQAGRNTLEDAAAAIRADARAERALLSECTEFLRDGMDPPDWTWRKALATRIAAAIRARESVDT